MKKIVIICFFMACGLGFAGAQEAEAAERATPVSETEAPDGSGAVALHGARQFMALITENERRRTAGYPSYLLGLPEMTALFDRDYFMLLRDERFFTINFYRAVQNDAVFTYLSDENAVDIAVGHKYRLVNGRKADDHEGMFRLYFNGDGKITDTEGFIDVQPVFDDGVVMTDRTAVNSLRNMKMNLRVQDFGNIIEEESAGENRHRTVINMVNFSAEEITDISLAVYYYDSEGYLIHTAPVIIIDDEASAPHSDSAGENIITVRSSVSTEGGVSTVNNRTVRGNRTDSRTGTALHRLKGRSQQTVYTAPVPEEILARTAVRRIFFEYPKGNGSF
jgi:hypothetical protein